MVRNMPGMVWRVRESSNGGFVAEYGSEHGGGVLAPSGVGVTMPAFIVYEMIRFESRRRAEAYIKRRTSK